jgi:predicted peptidase
MGAIGTWFLGAKYPDIWAALGTVAGTGNPQTMTAMKHIPQFVVHGDADPTRASRRVEAYGRGDEKARG